MRAPETKKKGKGANILKEIMNENVLNLIKNNLYIEEAK